MALRLIRKKPISSSSPSITVASAEEKRAAIAVRRFGRYFGDSRIDDHHSAASIDRASNTLVAMYSTLKDRRGYYFDCFDAAARGDVVTPLLEGTRAFVFNDVLDPRTDVPIALVRVTTALTLGSVIYLTNMGSMAEELRHIGESTDLHMSIFETSMGIEAKRLALPDTPCPALSNDIETIMRGNVSSTTIGLGPFAYPWLRQCPERTRELEIVVGRLRFFHDDQCPPGSRGIPLRSYSCYAERDIYAPWTLFCHIIVARTSRAIIILHMMNQLFQAWCPHNYGAVGWMLIKHRADPLGFETPAMQCRVAMLLMFARYQTNFISMFTGRDRELIADLIELMNKIQHKLTMELDVIDVFAGITNARLEANNYRVPPRTTVDLDAPASPSDEEDRPPVPDSLLDDSDDDEFERLEIVPEERSRPSILSSSPLLFPDDEPRPAIQKSESVCSTPFIMPGDDDAFDTYLTISPYFPVNSP